MTSELHCVEGRIQVVDGVPFYSPNSTVDVPLLLDKSLEGMNPFKPSRERRSEVRYADLLRPRRWQKAFYWTAFIPTNHWYKNYHFPPFHHLIQLPRIYYHFPLEDSGYYISQDNSFTKLENEIYRAVVALKNKFELPCVLPFLPNTLGYSDSYAKRSQLVHVLEETREWFSVWFGALSYCIAMAATRQEETEGLKFGGYPDWRQVLKDEGFSEGWIDDLVRSPIGQYSPMYPRVGCILEIVDEHDDQPIKSWFFDHSIPIWWRWGAEERACCQQYNLKSWIPKTISPTAAGEPSRSDIEPTSASGHLSLIKEPEWVDFFRRREARYPHILATETPKDRQRRENRTRNPPVRKAPVFEWLGSYDEPVTWKRTPVTMKCKQDTFDMYRRHQMRYDPFFNEWDLCEHFIFGEPDYEYDSDSEFDIAEQRPYPEIVASIDGSQETYPELDPPPDLFRPGSPSIAPPDHEQETASSSSTTAVQQEVEDVFGRYYGFCAPVLGTHFPDMSIIDRSADWFRRLLGLLPDEIDNHDYLTTIHYQNVQLFLDSNIGNKPATPSLSDLDDSSLTPVRLLPRFRDIVQVDLRSSYKDEDRFDRGEYLYILQPSNPTVPWRLACFSAITALLICRLPTDYTETSIAFYLSQRGIPFRVLSLPPRLRRPLHTPIFHALPIRRMNHRFTKEDYDSYVNQRTSLLGQPHMQAAIRRGGIVWRLAIATLGIADVVRDPTLWGPLFSPTPDLVEDTLTTVELDLLCGAYECVSDDGKQRALRSWWPLVRYYEKEECGENHGHWSNRRESWYGARVMNIQDPLSDAQPLTYTEWKSKLHGVKAIRNFLSHISKASANLLATHAAAVVPP
ncbi:hypothetical protein EST38_g6960 [Candolleomyces aberdarensis]|uniref:Uncharacterized protein n=1 Tax=Candolleomyces aberdarensis TaxID=2316362 RepID=A0A4Q2DIM8_9AGAR|nr:hypothetical protein EST38_g6960 [Candolleomyces aberdarensis]